MGNGKLAKITEGTTPSVPVTENLAVIETKTPEPDLAIVMLQTAIEKGMNVETIEKLLQMRESLRKEYAKTEFLKAFTMFQAEIPEIVKDKTVPNKDGSPRYSYATLGKIIEVIKPYLSKYNLSYRFETSFDDKSITIHCIIQHILGHSETTSFKIPIDNSPHMSDIQKHGSSMSYARRYSLCLALGLVADEDNEEILEKEEKPEPITEGQMKALFALLKDKAREERLQIVSSILGREISSSKELTKEEASKVIDALKNGKEPF